MSELPAEIRWCRALRPYAGGLLLGLFCAAAGLGQAVPESFEVGQRWVYRHEGPQPGDMEPNSIDGERILQVISVAGDQPDRQWVVEECFTNKKNVIGRFHVNREQMLTLLELENQKGEVAKLRYEPSIPYRAAGLAVGEKRAIETTLKIEGVEFSLPSTITTERLKDETVTTPAGEFAGCRHYRVTIASTVNIKIAKIPITEEREQWYHETVHGLVQEVYRRGPTKFLTWSRAGYTATSTLTAYGRGEVKPARVSATVTEANDTPIHEARRASSRPPARSSPRWILPVAGGILVGAGLAWMRRIRRR
jgi:hypothetical protein